MVVPNLIHPISVKIQQLDLSNTFQDDDYREPVQQAIYEDTKTVQGQLNWNMEKELKVDIGGVSTNASGYVLFRYFDLSLQSITLKMNDRFIQFGFVETDSYIIKLTPQGHYTDSSGPTLLKAFFVDRKPSRQRLDL